MPTPLPVVSIMYFLVSASPLMFCIVKPASFATSTNHADPEWPGLAGYGLPAWLLGDSAGRCAIAQFANNRQGTLIESIRTCLAQRSPTVMKLFLAVCWKGNAYSTTCKS